EEVKYGEFGCSDPFNRSNRSKFHVGTLGYYASTDNRPPYGEKIPSLEELTNKHKEESARRNTQMDESDLGASVNAMPRGIFEFLKLTNLRKTNMLIEVADMTALKSKQEPLKEAGTFRIRASKATHAPGASHLAIEGQSYKAPLGVVENILVEIDKFLFPYDFVNFTWGRYRYDYV
ncbi:hypothetical protein Tco_1560083, partial [Tanacetum coccineum]